MAVVDDHRDDWAGAEGVAEAEGADMMAEWSGRTIDEVCTRVTHTSADSQAIDNRAGGQQKSL